MDDRLGHTKGVKRGQVITRADAERFIRDDLAPIERHLTADLGMDRRWRYDAACPAPLMWAINSVYYYRGRKVMKTTGGTCATSPEITVFEEPEIDGRPLFE